MIINFQNKYYIAKDDEKLIPHAKRFVFEGQLYSAVKYGYEGYAILKGLGWENIPTPLSGFEYESYYYKPYEHQKLTTEFLVANKRAFCWNDAGTGKTASCIWALIFLARQAVIRRVLIVCPLSTVRAVWQAELFKMMPAVKVACLIGTKSRRDKLLQTKPFICCINHDGIKVMKDELLEWSPDLIIFDESTAFKNVSTSRWKVANLLRKKSKFTWLLTGTPAPQAPTDLFGQGRLVCPDLVGRSFKMFQSMTMTCLDPFGYKWVARPNVEDILKNVIKPVIRFERQDCLDLPDVVSQKYEVAFSKKQELAFTKLKKDALIQIDNELITAANEGVMRSKLLQVCGGYVYGIEEQGSKPTIDLLPRERTEAVLDIITETKNGILIFSPFRNAIQKLYEEVSKHTTAAIIIGDTSVKKRTRIFQAFQNEEIKVIIAHPKTMGHGVTLTAADTVIWYIVSSDNELYEQANARINRIGQEKKMRVIHMISTSLEKNVLQRLEEKRSMQGVLLETLGRSDDAIKSQ
jgi:SNF2 family DNA or RNA helicase